MSWDCLILTLIVCGIMSASANPAEPQGEPKSGWGDVFPEMAGYQRTFTKPVVEAGKKDVYRQTVKYEWTGGAIKLLEVTLARDPAFEKKYAADTLKKEPPPPREVMVGKMRAWMWKSDKLDAKEVWPLYARLVLPLTADRVLILDAKGQGPWQEITELVERFDLKKLERALDNPPAK